MYILIYLIFPQVPHSIGFDVNTNTRNLEDGLSNNGIINIEVLNSSKIFLGTAGGLNISEYDYQGNYVISHYAESDSLPIGGNPAITIKNDIIAVSGLISVETAIGDEQKGTGVSFSMNGGESWHYIPQPIDSSNQVNPSYQNKWGCSWEESNILYLDRNECNENCQDCHGQSKTCSMYNYISWGNQDSIKNFSVTTDVQNISYDLAIQGDYIYAASWAGSLRRFKYTEINNNSNPIWEVVPLPMDNQNSLSCNEINNQSYQINPVGNLVQYQNQECGYEFDNHKVFSVYSVEDTLWVGTAKGINKGIIDADNCISWNKMTSSEDGFYDDWVIGFEHQILDDETIRLWAITWDRQYAGSQLIYGGPPSYTDDGGNTWHVIDYLNEKDVLTYNISSTLNSVYVSTNKGAFINTSNQNNNLWSDFLLPDDITQDAVYDMEYMTNFNDIWIGTSQGVVVNDGNSFSINTSKSDVNTLFYSYPNPYILEEDNDITFVFNDQEDNINGRITIYDYGMDKVAIIYGSGITRWDGKNEYGDRVANGIYICHYEHNNNDSYYFKIMVIKD